MAATLSVRPWAVRGPGTGRRDSRPVTPAKPSTKFWRRCREPETGSVPAVNVTKRVAPAPRRTTMTKYLLLKHCRGAPAAVNDVPMDKWTPDEVSAHIQYMNDFAARLEG